MARKALTTLSQTANWTCRQCTLRSRSTATQTPFASRAATASLSTSARRREEVDVNITFDAGIEPRKLQIQAAPPIDEFTETTGAPARLVPASASYFTTSPVFNDQILRLSSLLARHGNLPTVSQEQAPKMLFMTLAQFRSVLAEKVGAAKYSKVVGVLRRLNLIEPRFRPAVVQEILEEFRRPGSENLQFAKPKTIDAYGRAKGVGRRKSAVARVQLIEGNGEVMINGKTIAEVFPRLHDRESVIWPLKITDRLDKYNVFVLSSGGGISGQAESVTLGLTNALMVHEPALKPVLRKAGCVTRIMKRVERKKHGRVKARKMPTWVKR